jgi:PAS domain-containing protein
MGSVARVSAESWLGPELTTTSDRRNAALNVAVFLLSIGGTSTVVGISADYLPYQCGASNHSVTSDARARPPLPTAAVRCPGVRKDAEKHLPQMEGRHRGLPEAAPDPMVVVNQGREIVPLNVQAEKQFGYHRDEPGGQKVKNIIPEASAKRQIADDLLSAADALGVR